MKNLSYLRSLPTKLFLVIIFFATATVSVSAEDESVHKAYVHALSDLRTARWLIDHSPEGWQKTDDEVAAVKAIDLAMARLIKADIDDGKYLNDRPDEDALPDRQTRLAAALQLLRKAHADINNDDNSTYSAELKNKEMPRINEAIASVEKALLSETGEATSSK